jgi:ring-1,2-phenylacetyl-CoA epoxidase subunit PaaC
MSALERLRPVVLAAADDELVLGHRDAEWTGLAPHVEEDVAFSSLAQDEMAHAAALYGLLAPEDPDGLACGRPPHGYLHARLLEAQSRDFAFAVVRQYLYDAFEGLRNDLFRRSACDELRAVAERMAREERYHGLHGRSLLAALAARGGQRLQAAVDAAWPLALGLFEPVAGEAEAVAAGALPAPVSGLLPAWRDAVTAELAGWGLRAPAAAAVLGGRRGEHGPDFDALWSDLTGMFRADPSRHW